MKSPRDSLHFFLKYFFKRPCKRFLWIYRLIIKKKKIEIKITKKLKITLFWFSIFYIIHQSCRFSYIWNKIRANNFIFIPENIKKIIDTIFFKLKRKLHNFSTFQTSWNSRFSIITLNKSWHAIRRLSNCVHWNAAKRDLAWTNWTVNISLR